MVLLIAASGLVYELIMGAVASYVLGDSVTQFSTVIGVYLFALGVGAYLSRFVTRRLNATFVDVELGTALVGGLSAPGLLAAFGYTGAFHTALYLAVLVVGALVGLELPLLIRILRSEYEFDELIARALGVDYAGALVGSLAFSLLLVPRLGLVHTSLACGLVNALVGLASTYLLVPGDDGERRTLVRARLRAWAVIALLGVGFAQASRLTQAAESTLYPGRVLVAAQSPYQRIVLAAHRQAVQLYLNGSLQFDGADEHRYHEALVHPAMAVARARQRVLVGGGGDGLATREVLKWPEVEQVTLVDLDQKVTDVSRDHPALSSLNRRSLSDPRVEVVNADAMRWFAETDRRFDVVILDFPDPSTYSVGKLYTERFFRTTRDLLRPGAALVIQSTSPFIARHAYWCVVHTLASVGFTVAPYHAFLPSFGEWGFVLGKTEAFTWPAELPELGFRFLDRATLASLTRFAPDLGEVLTHVNRLNNQALVAYYLDAWRRYN
jgi:spermidine synthase